MASKSDTSPDTRKREDHLSSDGQWRSFPKVPHLLQYVNNGRYYGRINVDGKLIRKNLKTTTWTTAKLRLVDFLKAQNENRNNIEVPTFKEALESFKAELESDSTIKLSSKGYRLGCILKLEKTWAELWNLHLNEITPQACKDWAAKCDLKFQPPSLV